MNKIENIPVMSKVHNYSAGPCILPQEVFQQASDALLNFNGLDLSLIEISHRSVDFIEVMEEARSLVKEVMNVPDGYHVLFLQGGASLGFLTAAYNMMRKNRSGGYLITGSWAKKAAKEVTFIGEKIVLASSEDGNFNYIPKGYDIPENIDYIHITSNNTIFGTQIKEFPKSNIPLVCDMSSDILSKEIDVSNFDLIYGGAQKNLGPSGTTLYIVKDEVLGNSSVPIPTMLDLKTHYDSDSMFNTPPVFAIYTSMLTLRWIKENGGLASIESNNNIKASLMYSEIDRNSLFTGTAVKEDRSNMNATFTLTNEHLKDDFDRMLEEMNIIGLKGHRSVGGYRASMYNALPVESVEVLVDVMKELEVKFG